MLSSISWAQMLTYCGAVLLLYYLWYVIKYARRNRKGAGPAPAPKFKRKWRMEEPGQLSGSPAPEDLNAARPGQGDGGSDESGSFSTEEEQQYDALEGLARDVLFVLQDFGDQGNRKALLERLRAEVQRYPTLQQNPAFRNAINRVIIDGARQQCHLSITAEEADWLWDLAE